MALNPWFPHRCGRNYWDVWDWPQSLFGQHFGQDFDDMLAPLKSGPLAHRSGESQVANSSDKFSIRLDCSHFKPEEIEVKTIGNTVTIHGRHEERNDSHGWIQREFTRRYVLPDGCEPEAVISRLDPKGVLQIEAPKKQQKQLTGERVVPIDVANK